MRVGESAAHPRRRAIMCVRNHALCRGSHGSWTGLLRAAERRDRRRKRRLPTIPSLLGRIELVRHVNACFPMAHFAFVASVSNGRPDGSSWDKQSRPIDVHASMPHLASMDPGCLHRGTWDDASTINETTTKAIHTQARTSKNGECPDQHDIPPTRQHSPTSTTAHATHARAGVASALRTKPNIPMHKEKRDIGSGG